jgi:hypothetical protein
VLWRLNGQKMTNFERSDVRVIARFSIAFVTALAWCLLFLSGFFFFWSAGTAETSVRLNLNIRDEELKKTVKIRNKPVHDARFFEHGETKGKWENTEDMVR